MRIKLLGVAITALLSASCANPPVAAEADATSPTAQAPASEPAPAIVPTHLVALLPMRDGFGPADQDAYEASIAPVAADHGMRRETAYTITRFLGGAGPKNASTFGVWSLGKPSTLQDVMGDARYQAKVPQRDRVHDMANVAMYVTQADVDAIAPQPGHALLVGVIATRPGFGYRDHAAYEESIAKVTGRHGMRLVRSYRVLQSMGAGLKNAAAVAVWDLESPEVLGKVMSDPEYVANVGNRDRIHDMAATTMYFVSPRKAN